MQPGWGAGVATLLRGGGAPASEGGKSTQLGGGHKNTAQGTSHAILIEKGQRNKKNEKIGEEID